jgi:putative transposase
MSGRLTEFSVLGQHVRNWRALLKLGLDAMDDLAKVDQIEARIRTGRPPASPEWIAEAEAAMDRTMGPQKRGPKAKGDGRDGI